MVRTVTEQLAREIYNPLQRDRVVFLKTSSFSERFMVDEGELGAQIAKRRAIACS